MKKKTAIHAIFGLVMLGAFLFSFSFSNAWPAWPTLKGEKKTEKQAQSAPTLIPPQRPTKESTANIDTILSTLNESLEENKKLRTETESGQDLLNRTNLENNVLRSQLRTLQSQADSYKNELSDKQKQVQDDVVKLNQQIVNLKEDSQKSEEFKALTQETLVSTDAENKKLKKLLESAILQSERDSYVKILNESSKKSDEAARQLMVARHQSERMKYELASAYYNLGTMLSDAGNHKSAVLQYKKALHLNPNDAWSHYNLGVIYDYYLNNHDKSLYHYKKYLKLEPLKEELNKIRERILEIELKEPVTPNTPLKADFQDYQKKLNKSYTIPQNS